jgi:protein involved in polysaccharide export with SLBB domain
MNKKLKIQVLILLVVSMLCPISIGQILPGKAVQITIQGVPSEEKSRIDGIYPVSDSGYINMPYIDTVHAAGLRNEDLAVSVQSRYKSLGIYTNPTIQVLSNTGDKIDEKMIYLGGQVRAPGPKSYSQGLTLYQAVQAAGGANEFGSMKRVRIFRGGKAVEYDLSQPQFMTVPVQPNDTIEVPQKNMFGQ